MSTSKQSGARLGNDPFADMFPGKKVKSQQKITKTAKKRPPNSAQVGKKRVSNARVAKRPATPSKAKLSPPEATLFSENSDFPSPVPSVHIPPVSNQPIEWNLDQIENRLDEALQQLHDMPLPDGPLPKSTTDELFELLRSTLRSFSPVHYYKQLNQFLYSERSLTVDPFGLDPEFEERAERLADFFYKIWWRVDAHGVEHVPSGGRTLLVSNHSGMLPYDGAMIKQAVRLNHPARRTVRFLVENFAFYLPILGTLIYRYGGVRASMDNAVRLLNDDQLTAVFPEGVKGLGKHYRHRYQLQRFGRGGFVKLAMKTRSPIMPVGVIGAEEIHPIIGNADFLRKPLRLPYVPITPTFPALGPLGLIPLPTKWTIVFGEPLTFTLDYGPDEADNELLINELTLKVRRLIHEMIYDQLADRKSIFFG